MRLRVELNLVQFSIVRIQWIEWTGTGTVRYLWKLNDLLKSDFTLALTTCSFNIHKFITDLRSHMTILLVFCANWKLCVKPKTSDSIESVLPVPSNMICFSMFYFVVPWQKNNVAISTFGSWYTFTSSGNQPVFNGEKKSICQLPSCQLSSIVRDA